MCGKQIIRYVHHMVHPNYHPLNVGCICAGKMEGDIETAKKRENEFKNKEKRKENFLKLKWKTSRNGNSFLKNKKHHIVLYNLRIHIYGNMLWMVNFVTKTIKQNKKQ